MASAGKRKFEERSRSLRCRRDDNREANSRLHGRAKKDGDVKSPVHEPQKGRTKVRPLQRPKRGHDILCPYTKKSEDAGLKARLYEVKGEWHSQDSSRKDRAMGKSLAVPRRAREARSISKRLNETKRCVEKIFCDYFSFFVFLAAKARASSMILAMRRSRASGVR